MKLPPSIESQKKQENSRKKTSTSAFSNYVKPFDCGSQQTGNFFKRWKYQTTLPTFCETCMQINKQQLEPDMEQWTGSKLRKEYIKAVYCHPAYLTYTQSTSCEMLGWKKHKLESRLLGEISITLICRWHHPYGRKWRGTKQPLDERGEWKS